MKSNKILKNVLWGSIYKTISILIKFILRAFLISGLGSELVGLNTVISDWMSMLNLATLGIEIAIQFSLYEPLARKDQARVEIIVHSAQMVYRKIGLFILFAGIALMPFLPLLIKDVSYLNFYIYGAYILALIGVALSYLWCYKRIVLQACQDVYLVHIIDIFSEVVFIGLEIAVVVKFNSLYLFLAIGSLKLILQHSLTSYICDKKYKIPKIKERNISEEKKITSDLKDVAPLKLANYIYGYTDNILISKFVGLSAVTIYSNYMIIVNALMGISTMVVNATKSAFGIELNNEVEKMRTEKMLKRYIFCQYIFASISSLSFYLIVDEFIDLWIGSPYRILKPVMIIMTVEIFMRLICQPLQMMFEAMGRFKSDKKITLITVVINIVLSIILVNFLGMIGPVIGTLVTDIVILGYRMKYIQFEYYNQSTAKVLMYWTHITGSFGIGFLLVVFWRFYLERTFSGVVYMFVGEIGTIIICLFSVIIFWSKTEEYQDMKKMFKTYLTQIIRRTK